MMERSVRIFQIKSSVSYTSALQQMRPIDICFYRFIGGNPSETKELVEQLHTIKESKVLLIGLFRFPFRFEGKKRLQTAIHQYYLMRDIVDAGIHFQSEGMMASMGKDTPVQEANLKFNRIEETVVTELQSLVEETGEMNIDAKDIQTFIRLMKGPLFFHTFEGENFDEPLKYAINAPYLSPDYADGKQMMINIGCTREVDMESFRLMNLRLQDLFHKAELFKLGTYFIDEPGHRFKITLLVNGLKDPYTRPEDMKRHILLPSIRFKNKWKKTLTKGKEKMVFHHKHI